MRFNLFSKKLYTLVRRGINGIPVTSTLRQAQGTSELVTYFRFHVLAVVCVTLLAIVVFPVDAQEEAGNIGLSIIAYSKFEGLLANDITGFVQDEAGYLYLATNQGIWKYNGSQFYQILTTRQGLTSNKVQALFQDSQGNLWASTSKGLNKISQNQVVDRFSPDAAVWVAPTEDAEGHIWYTADSTLVELIDNTISQTYNEVNGVKNPFIPRTDLQNRLWVGTEDGLVQLQDGQVVQQITEAEGLYQNSIHQLFEDPDGHLWVTDIDGRLSRITDGQAEIILEPIAGYFQAALVDREGTIWLGSSHGLIYYRLGESPQRLTTEHGLVDNNVLSLFEDRAGNIWVGTANGVNKIAPEPLMQGIVGPRIYAQLVDQAGVVWLGSATGVYQLVDNHLSKAYAIEDGLGSDNIKALVEDSQNRVWVGTTIGLTVIDSQGAVSQTYTTVDGLPSDEIWSLLIDSQARLWVGTSNGIALIENDEVRATFSGVANSTAETRIEALMEGKDGSIFVGARGYGLTRLESDGSFIKQYSEVDGFVGSRVRGLATDAEGNLWVPVADAGVVYHLVDGQIVARYRNDDDVILSEPRAVVIGPNGTVWVGLDSLGLSSLDSNGFLKNYSYADGLINSTVYSLSTDHHDNILIGTGSGLVRFDATPFQLDLRLDELTLPQIDEQGQAYEIPLAPQADGSYQIDYNQQSIRFRYASLDYRVDTKRFQTRLEGYDQFWQDMGMRTERTYMNLSAGDYTFKVRVQYFDGRWNPEEVAVNLSVLPPWWQTPPAIGLGVIAVIGLLFGFIRWRVRAVEKQNQLLEAQVLERTKALTERSEQLAESNTRLAHTNDELAVAKQKADVANEAKSTFLANMSHELRSPLNAILGFTQIMHRSSLTRDNREHLNIINSSGEHLLALINQVLDLSKIEAGRTTMNQYDFSLSQLLEDVENMFRLKAEANGLWLTFHQADDTPRYIHTDGVKLRQVLINLVSNALKFTKVGGVTVRVGVREKLDESNDESNQAMLQFEVEDSGPGIAPDELDDLFEAFVQTQTGQQSKEGTGLGLPISRKFVQLMGGELTVISPVFPNQENSGANFQFTIPVKPLSRLESHSAKQATKRVIALQPNQPTYRILLVDDKPLNRLLLVKMLEPLGFALQEASNGQEAIEIWSTWQPHLILMDMRMPVMDGFETTERIKAHLKGQATAIIALTASVFEEEKAIILSAGCDGLVRKPFQEHEIFETLHEHIGVTYVYEDSNSADNGHDIQPHHEELRKTLERRRLNLPKPTSASSVCVTPHHEERLRLQLAELPPDILDPFYIAATENDLSTVNGLLRLIRGQNGDLAEALTVLADDFEYQTIAEIIQQARALAHE